MYEYDGKKICINFSWKDFPRNMIISTNGTNRSDIFAIIGWNNLVFKTRHYTFILDQIFALILMSRILLFLFHRSIISRCLYCVRMLECDAMVQISSLLCIRAELRENLSRIREIERNWKWRLFGIGRTVECFCQTNEEIRKF